MILSNTLGSLAKICNWKFLEFSNFFRFWWKLGNTISGEFFAVFRRNKTPKKNIFFFIKKGQLAVWVCSNWYIFQTVLSISFSHLSMLFALFGTVIFIGLIGEKCSFLALFRIFLTVFMLVRINDLPHKKCCVTCGIEKFCRFLFYSIFFCYKFSFSGSNVLLSVIWAWFLVEPIYIHLHTVQVKGRNTVCFLEVFSLLSLE